MKILSECGAGRCHEGLGGRNFQRSYGYTGSFADADYDSVTSTPADFRRLAPKVVEKALRQTGVITLEPYMNYRLIAPAGDEKRIMAKLAKLQASVENVIYSDGEMEVLGEVPFDTAKEFQVDLRSMTDGKGIFEMEFLEYRRNRQE